MRDPFPTPGIADYRHLNVVVTGASGLIGSYAVKLLKESGANVTAVINTRPANEFTKLADRVVWADLQIPAEAEAVVRGADVVIGGAGITGGIGLVAHDPVSYVGPATNLVVNTLHACHKAGVSRFGFLSSTTVYPAQSTPVKESELSFADEPYHLYRGIGWSKRFLEKLCAYYTDTTKVRAAVIRPSGAYGRFDNFDEKTSHVIPGMIQRALKAQDTFEVWGDGTDTRDIIHAQDVARAFLLATIVQTPTPTVNIASGKGVTTLEMASAVLKAAGSQAKPVTNPAKPVALKTRLVDVTWAKHYLGFEPEISLNDGLSDTVAWFRAQKEG